MREVEGRWAESRVVMSESEGRRNRPRGRKREMNRRPGVDAWGSA